MDREQRDRLRALLANMTSEWIPAENHVNAEAIAAAVNALPALLDEVEALESHVAAKSCWRDCPCETRKAEAERDRAREEVRALREIQGVDRHALNHIKSLRDDVKAEREACDAACARVAELQQELDHERAWHESNVETLHRQSHPRDVERIATLEAGLRKYGRHQRVAHELFDPRTKITRVSDGRCNGEIGGVCSCGLDAALARPRLGRSK